MMTLSKTRAYSLLLTVFLTGCAVNQVRDMGNGETLAAVRDVNYAVAKQKAEESANTYCHTRGGGVKYLRVEEPYDNIGAAYYLYFSCFDWAAYEADKKKKEEQKRAEEARLRAIEAERVKKEEAERLKRQQIAEEEQRKRLAEEERVRKAKKENLRKAGIYETNVMDLIVNFDFYRGKKVFLRCNVHSADKYGAQCDDLNNDKQSVSLEPEKMDKNFKIFLLNHCSNYYYRDNSYDCRKVGVVGTVTGASVPHIEGAVNFDY